MATAATFSTSSGLKVFSFFAWKCYIYPFQIVSCVQGDCRIPVKIRHTWIMRMTTPLLFRIKKNYIKNHSIYIVMGWEVASFCGVQVTSAGFPIFRLHAWPLWAKQMQSMHLILQNLQRAYYHIQRNYDFQNTGYLLSGLSDFTLWDICLQHLIHEISHSLGEYHNKPSFLQPFFIFEYFFQYYLIPYQSHHPMKWYKA